MDKIIYNFFLGMILGGFFSIILITFTNSKYPTALDVYRGKTTLEVTYIDNVPIDSVVVFKNK